jgi:hypothetical protein
MDDLIGRECVKRNHYEEINPKMLLYIKSNEKLSDLQVFNEISNNDICKAKFKEEDFMICEFDDDIPVDLEYEEDDSDHEEICKNSALIPNCITLSRTCMSYNSLCPYNSVLNGFVAACKFDKYFFEFVKRNQNNYKYFEAILKLLNESSQEIRNEIWIKFLTFILKDEKFSAEEFPNGYPFKESSSNSFSMNWDVLNFYDVILKKNEKLFSYSYRLTCNCGYERKKEVCVITVSSGPTTFVNNLKSLDSIISEKYGKTCSKCKGKLEEEIIYSNVLVIYSLFGLEKHVEIPLSKIPLSIVQNNENYSLKFLVNYINNDDPNTNHFDCYAFNKNVKKFFHIDDLGQREREISKSSTVKIFPKILFYFKNQ